VGVSGALAPPVVLGEEAVERAGVAAADVTGGRREARQRALQRLARERQRHRGGPAAAVVAVLAVEQQRPLPRLEQRHEAAHLVLRRPVVELDAHVRALHAELAAGAHLVGVPALTGARPAQVDDGADGVALEQASPLRCRGLAGDEQAGGHLDDAHRPVVARAQRPDACGDRGESERCGEEAPPLHRRARVPVANVRRNA